MQQDPELSAQQGAGQAVVSKRRQRVYQHWQGNERFFCWGFLVAGPNWKASLGTAALITAPAGIYLAFVAPYMGLHVHVVILVISCILPVLAIWFLMLTACRDPGIIPRQEPDQEYLSGQKPRTREVFVNNQRVVIRYNDTCHFYQPPRAHHCSVNDNCIERFDHHCPWVGTTIGLRNYRSFLLFVYTSTVLCLYVFGVCVAMLFVKHNQLAGEAREAGGETGGLWGKTAGKCIPALALMGYTFVFFWFVGGLSVFHAYLVATNQTTYENFRYNHDNRPNPYSRGILSNCAEVWCSPIPPSKVQFRAFIDEFKPPTGQPYSPYLNGGENGFGAASGASQGHGGVGGAAAGGDMQMAAMQGGGIQGEMDGPGSGLPAPPGVGAQFRGSVAPLPLASQQQPLHQVSGLTAGVLAAHNNSSSAGGAVPASAAAGGYAYGPQHSIGGVGGGGVGGGGGGMALPYDPAAAALQHSASGHHLQAHHYQQQQQQQYNLPYNHPANNSGRFHQQQQHQQDMSRRSGSGGGAAGGPMHSHHSYSSDAGAGWGVGGGARNEQPPAAMVKGQHGSAFTSQAGGGSSRGLNMGGGGGGFGASYGNGGGGGSMGGAVVPGGQHPQHQQYYGGGGGYPPPHPHSHHSHHHQGRGGGGGAAEGDGQQSYGYDDSYGNDDYEVYDDGEGEYDDDGDEDEGQG
ncbi:hypothetical protein Agub_g13449, partial [Astrephomene gubernaculifera]